MTPERHERDHEFISEVRGALTFLRFIAILSAAGLGFDIYLVIHVSHP